MSELTSWLSEVSAASPLAFVLVAAAGLLMGVAPSSLPLLSVVVGTVAAQDNARDRAGARGLTFASGFVLGIATVDAIVGAVFAFVGMLAIQVLAESRVATNLAIALVLAIMGLALLRLIRVPWLRLQAQPRAVRSFGGAYALGIPFGLSTCPVCTPMVLPVLGAAATAATPWLGAALLFTFGLARGVPLIVAGAATGSLKHVRRMTPLVPSIERIGGMLVLITAAFFAYHSAVYTGWVPPIPFIDY